MVCTKKIYKQRINRKTDGCLRRAQASTEILVILAVLLIVLAAIVFVLQDTPGELSAWWQQRNVGAWGDAPVAVQTIYYADGNLSVVLYNNQRFSVLVHNLTLSGVSFTSNTTPLLSGHTQIYTRSFSSALVRPSYFPKIVFSSSDESITNITGRTWLAFSNYNMIFCLFFVHACAAHQLLAFKTHISKSLYNHFANFKGY